MSIDFDPDWWKTLFDDVYLITDARSVDNDALTCREVNLISELLPLQPDQRILDLCGGQGRHALELCQRGFGPCTVIDYSHVLLRHGVQRARRRQLPVVFIEADARNLPLPSAHYQHVMVLGNSLGYAGQAKADIQILQEARRLLDKEGWLLVDVTDGEAVRRHFTPNTWHEIGQEVVVCRQRELGNKRIRAREMVINKATGLVRDNTYGLRLYTSDELIEMVSATGFSHAQMHKNFSYSHSKEDLGFMNHRMFITAKKR